MMMTLATLSMDGREGGRERDKKNKGSRDNSHFTPSFQCRQTIFCALVSSLFHLLMTTKFIHFVQDLVAYNRRNDGLTDPVKRKRREPCHNT